MWERAAGVVPSLCLSWPANLARSASRSGPRLASLAKPSRPQVGLHRTSKDGTYNLWLALTTSAWVLSCTNDHFSTLNCIHLDLATHAWLMSHKNGPITTLRCIDRSSCNSCVAYVVHRRSLRRGTAE